MAVAATRLRSVVQSAQCLNARLSVLRSSLPNNSTAFTRLLCDRIIDRPDQGPQIPSYKAPENEPVHLKRARLLYQSRKRGMSENGLLLSTFADQYLNNMDEATLVQYDKVINQPSNDWELYYWITEAKPTPKEYEGPVMDMLKMHAKNRNMDVRIRQPDLQPSDK